jgi:hypothetical protein
MPNTEQNELLLYVTNDGDLYHQRAQPMIKNLAKKMAKGAYDHAKAAKLWLYLADAGAQKYTKEFDSDYSSSYGAFSKADRVAVAKSLADHYREEVEELAGRKSNPVHRRYKMARRKKSKVRGTVVKFHQGRKVVRVVFRRAKKTPAAKAAARRRGKALARKWGFFKKKGAIWQRRGGRKAKLIRRI